MKVLSANNIKEVVLHVGLQKTGTSSIQDTLYNEANNQLLLKEGILYPKCWGANHSSLGGAFHDQPKKLRANRFPKVLTKEEIIRKDRKKLEKFESTLKQHKAKRLVISGEGICLLNRKSLQEMKDYLFNIGLSKADFKVLIYTRDPISWTVSYLQEKIKYGTKSDDLLNNFKNKLLPAMFQDRIGKFIDVFGENSVNVYSFEEARNHEFGISGHFLESINVHKNVIKNIKQVRKNESLSMFTGEFLIDINEKVPLIINGKHNPKRKREDHQPFFQIRGNKFDISIDEKKQLLSVSEKDRAWLKERYDINYLYNDLNEKEKYADLEFVFQDIKKIYPSLTKTMSDALIDFLKNKFIFEIPSSYKDQCRELIMRLKNVDGNETNDVKLDQAEQHFREELNIKGQDKGLLYREIGLLLEGYNQPTSASFFFEQEKLHRPNDNSKNEIKWENVSADKNILQNSQLYFVIQGIPKDFGGVVQAVLRKTKLLDEKIKIPSTILTCNFVLNQKTTKEKLVNNNQISQRVEVRNLFEDFADEPVIESASKKEEVFNPYGYAVEFDKEKNGYRFYENGIMKFLKVFDKETGRLRHIHYYDEWRRRIEQETYDDDGYLRRVLMVDHLTNRPTTKLFYRRDGSCYLTFWYKMDNLDEIAKITWFDLKGNIIKVFKSKQAMQSYWLKTFIHSGRHNFFVCEKRPFDQTVIGLPDKSYIHKIMSHHGYPDVRFPKSFKSVDKVDAFVVQTEGYKKDIEQQFGKIENLFAIPHYYPFPQPKVKFDERNLKKAVYIARYLEVKRQSHAIRAFKLVVDEVPDATLELYGSDRGTENKLRKLIKELKMENHIFLCGYTSNPRYYYETSAMSLLTSRKESFSLVTLESLAHGCPVISYDIKYGPSDLIENNTNGFLVPNEDINTLAVRMIELFKNKRMLQEFSQNAYNSVEKFSGDHYINNWTRLFNYIVKNNSDNYQ